MVIYTTTRESQLIHRVHHAKCHPGWITSWNQDFLEKYQQPQICRWYTLMAEREKELKRLLMRVKEEERKTGLKLNMQKIKLMASTPIISWQKDGGKVETVKYFFYFLGLQNHCGWWLKLWNLKMLSPWKKSYDKLRQCIKKQRHHFANKNLYHQSYGSSSGHVWMWELDHKEGWVPKNWCFQIVVLDKILESPLDCKETKPVNPKGNQLWIFTGS